MRFLIITPMFAPSYAYGGPPRSALGLAQGLQAAGHHVAVLASHGNGPENLSLPSDQWISYEGIPVNYLSRRGRGLYFYTPGLARVLTSCLPDFDMAIIRSHWTYFNWRATSILQKAGKPYLESVLGSFDDWAMRRHMLRKRIYWYLVERSCFTGAAGFIALTQDEIGHFRKMGLHQPVAVVPNGVDLDELSRPGPPAESLFPALAGRRYILFLGRLHMKKAVEKLIQAFSLLKPAYPDTKLVIAGSGDKPYMDSLRSQASQLGLEQEILFTGFVEGEVRRALFHSAYAFSLPSFCEGMPMGALEALACGVPVVVTPQCNLNEVQAEGAGLVADNEPSELSSALDELLRDPQVRDEMSTRARSLAWRCYSWKSSAEKLAHFAHELLNQSKGNLPG